VQAKSSDFGLSRLLTRHAKLLGGSLVWMPPEVFHRSAALRPKPNSVIFSFGRLLFLVVTGTSDLKDMDREAIAECLDEARFPPLDWPKASAFEELSKDLVDECLNVEESLQPSTKDVYKAIIAWPCDSPVTKMQALSLRGVRVCGTSLRGLSWLWVLMRGNLLPWDPPTTARSLRWHFPRSRQPTLRRWQRCWRRSALGFLRFALGRVASLMWECWRPESGRV